MTWSFKLAALPVARLLHRRHVYPALVSNDQLHTLRQLAQQSLSTNLDMDLEVHQRLLGERLSPFIKQGYEFAEIRPYQPGDSVRFINWRRYASTGQLYINRFQEERRPQCWLVIDRRSTMCFGTRVRLKVAQAALLAIYHLYKAHYQQMAIGAVILDTHSHWYEARSSNADIQILQQHIIAACPPPSDGPNEPQLDYVLRQLRVRCQPGCLIFIFSDFHDLSPAASPSLAALSEAHLLNTFHIVDRVETALPASGNFALVDEHSTEIRQVDCNNTITMQAHNRALQQSLADTERLLTRHELHYRRLYADEELLTTRQLQYG